MDENMDQHFLLWTCWTTSFASVCLRCCKQLRKNGIASAAQTLDVAFKCEAIKSKNIPSMPPCIGIWPTEDCICMYMHVLHVCVVIDRPSSQDECWECPFRVLSGSGVLHQIDKEPSNLITTKNGTCSIGFWNCIAVWWYGTTCKFRHHIENVS